MILYISMNCFKKEKLKMPARSKWLKDEKK